MPPKALLAKSAAFGDAAFKWGLSSDYDRWLQAAHERRAVVLDELLDFDSLAWYDTLAWLEEDEQPDGRPPFSSSYVLVTLTDGILPPHSARDEDAYAVASLLGDALVSTFLEKVRVLHCDTMNATTVGLALARVTGDALYANDPPPFNYLRVHSATTTALARAGDTLAAVVDKLDAGDRRTFFAKELALVQSALES